MICEQSAETLITFKAQATPTTFQIFLGNTKFNFFYIAIDGLCLLRFLRSDNYLPKYAE